MPRPTKLHQACKSALVDYLGLTIDETLLIVTDENELEIARELYNVSKKLSHESILLEMSARKSNSEEPPLAVTEIMKSVDVVICPTTKSLTHTKSKREATKLGVRIATMPGITKETLIRCLSADPKKIEQLAEKLFQRMRGVREIYVETKMGTEITMPVKRRRIIVSTGILKNIGASGNLPSGEVFIAPVEDESNGTIVFDGSIAGIGLLKNKVTVEIKKGYIKNISGGKEAIAFEKMLKSVNNYRALALAEFGIGINDKAQICGDILEDEKVLGTIHIAFGNNLTMGGKIKVSSHVDGLITKPDVYFDKEQVMKNGKLMI